MASFLVFVLVGVVPLLFYLGNALIAMRSKRDLGNRGIAAGIPKPKQAKPARNRSRKGRLSGRRVGYCGKDFRHIALAIVGSQDSCRYCTYLEEVPPPPPPDGDADAPNDSEAAVRAAEEIIDRAQH